MITETVEIRKELLIMQGREHMDVCVKVADLLRVLQYIEQTTTDLESMQLAKSVLSSYETVKH